MLTKISLKDVYRDYPDAPRIAAVDAAELAAVCDKLLNFLGYFKGRSGWKTIGGSLSPHVATLQLLKRVDAIAFDFRQGRELPPQCPDTLATVDHAVRYVNNVAKWAEGLIAPAGETVAGAELPTMPHYSVSDLAAKHGVDGEKLRKRLIRWQLDHDTGYTEVTNRKPTDPRYLYDETVVLPVVQKLKDADARKRAANGRRKIS